MHTSPCMAHERPVRLSLKTNVYDGEITCVETREWGAVTFLERGDKVYCGERGDGEMAGLGWVGVTIQSRRMASAGFARLLVVRVVQGR